MEKFTPPQEEESDLIPLMITRDMHQSLADLGWKKENRSSLTPLAAHEIIKSNTRFEEDTKAEEVETKNVQNDWDLLNQRWHHALDSLDDSHQSNTLIELSSSSKTNPEELYAYLNRNQATLSPAQTEFLQADIARKTRNRDRQNNN